MACTSLPALVTEPSCWDCGTVPKLTILAGALLQRLLVRNDQRPQRAVALAHQHTKPAGVGWHGRAPAWRACTRPHGLRGRAHARRKACAAGIAASASLMMPCKVPGCQPAAAEAAAVWDSPDVGRHLHQVFNGLRLDVLCEQQWQQGGHVLFGNDSREGCSFQQQGRYPVQ